jgi:glycosyltransferase involved in cell wall biosynthesis
MADPELHEHGPLAGAATLTAREPAAFAAGIHELLADPDRAARLSAGAARQAASLSPHAYAEAMSSVYSAVLPRG